MLNHFALREAIERGDHRLAREIIQAWLDDPRTTGYAPLQLSYVSKYAMHAGDREMRDFVLTHAAAMSLSPTDTIDYREGVGLTFFHLGVAFLPDRDLALPWLDKALDAVPGFLPAVVEREIIVRGLEREVVFAASGRKCRVWRGAGRAGGQRDPVRPDADDPAGYRVVPAGPLR